MKTSAVPQSFAEDSAASLNTLKTSAVSQDPVEGSVPFLSTLKTSAAPPKTALSDARSLKSIFENPLATALPSENLFEDPLKIALGGVVFGKFR